MSIFGIGIDLCEIARVQHSIDKYGEKFAKKLLSANELEAFNKHRFPARFLAKRFAAKEAFAKAFGTGIADGLTLPQIEIVNDDKGKPLIRLLSQARVLFSRADAGLIHLSISDEQHYAVAQVLIEKA